MSSERVAEYFRLNQKIVQRCLAGMPDRIEEVALAIVVSLRHGGKLICFGNGGSSSQASHMAGELVGRFKSNRRALPAISLSSDPATVTCIANDFGYDSVFERQIEAFAVEGDVALGLTTSGRSENVLRALTAARKKGARTVALCGERGLASQVADYVISVPSDVTAHIQEVHLMILHCLCIAIEDAFPEDGKKS
jgi:D-sedoheptulose 7-phosphate isomerase